MTCRHQTLRPSGESGLSIVELLIGLALSAISILAVTQFYFRSLADSRDTMGNTDAVGHWGLILHDSLSSGNCLSVDFLKASFKKSIGGSPKVVGSWNATQLKTAKLKDKMVSLLPTGASSYKVSSLTMIQKSNVIGTDPGRVFAEVEISYVTSGNAAKPTGKIYKLTVPALFDLDPSMKAKACLKLPTPQEMCTQTGHKWNGGGNACT